MQIAMEGDARGARSGPTHLARLHLLIQSPRLHAPAVDRAQRAAEEMAQFVLAREFSIRLLFASTDQEPRDLEAATGLPRPSFRRRLVEAVLHGAEETLGADPLYEQPGLDAAVDWVCDSAPPLAAMAAVRGQPDAGMKTVAMCVAVAFFEIWGRAGLPDNG